MLLIKFPRLPVKLHLRVLEAHFIFFTKFIERLHFNLKLFYDLLHEKTLWSGTTEHETFFHKLKNDLTSDTKLTIPNTKHLFSLQLVRH